jgi:hypothetical protein
MTILGLDTPFNTNPSDITNSSTDTSEPRRYSLGVGAVDSGTEGGGEEAKVAAAAGEEPDYYKKGLIFALMLLNALVPPPPPVLPPPTHPNASKHSDT